MSEINLPTLAPKFAYSPQEAATALGISKPTYYRLLRKKEIETFDWLGKRYVRADALQAFVDRKSGRAA